LLTLLLKPDDINKEFILKIIKVSPYFYKHIQENPRTYKNLNKDEDIISTAISSGLNLKKININSIKNLLLSDSNDNQNICVKYLIETDNVNDYSLFQDKDDMQKFNLKYKHLEYLFFNKDSNYSYENKDRNKMLSKLKTKEEVFELFEKIDNLNFPYRINNIGLIDGLHPKLKSNNVIIETIIEKHGIIPYSKID